MDVDLIVDQMRSAVFPDRWTESRTWAASRWPGTHAHT